MRLVPTPDEVAAFIDDYDAARDQPLTAEQRSGIHAAAAFLIAYTARCEHALGARGDFSQALRSHGAAYLPG